MSSYRSPYLRKTLDSTLTDRADDGEIPARESRFKRDDSTGTSAYSSSGYTARRFAGALRDGSAFGAPSTEEPPTTETAIPYSSAARRFRREESVNSTVSAASTIVSPARERVKAALSLAQDEDENENEKYNRKVLLQEEAEVLNEEDLESRNSSVDKKDGDDDHKTENGFGRQRSTISQSSGDMPTKRSSVEYSVDEDSQLAKVKIQLGKSIDDYTENEEESENHNHRLRNLHESDSVEEKEPPKAITKRVPLKRDFTQNSVSKERQPASQIDENDWAKRNQGRNKVLGLIAKFSSAASDPSVVSNASTNYKTEHDFSKIGQIKLSKFK